MVDLLLHPYWREHSQPGPLTSCASCTGISCRAM
jgi:hypothetical protein